MADNGLTHLLNNRRSVREYTSEPVALKDVHRLIWAAQGKTAADGKRTAPSAHALHPLRLCLSVFEVDGLETGLYRISPDGGALSQVHTRNISAGLQEAALEDQPWIGNSACILSICADLIAPSRAFADQPPYGERGPRYVYLEAGAAAQNVLLQAVELGLASVLVAGFEDERTGKLLELEHGVRPLIHLPIGHPVD